MKGEAEVRRRISLIDDVPPGTSSQSSLIKDLMRFTQIMSGSANVHAPVPPVAEPHELDELVKKCFTLQRIAASAPSLVSGDFSLRQLWTGAAARSGHDSASIMTPSAGNFRHLSASGKPRVKPIGEGLYTSTPLPGLPNASMWRMYLEHYGEALFPRPWRTYELIASSQVRIYEVDTAATWAKLISQYPAKYKGLVYPDWQRIAMDYDAVHFTLAAIVAMQEIRLRFENLTVAEGYWDTEQTFWLNWQFDKASEL